LNCAPVVAVERALKAGVLVSASAAARPDWRFEESACAASPDPTGYQQAKRCPSPAVRSGGASLRQRCWT